MEQSPEDEAIQSLHTFFNGRKINIYNRVAILEIFKDIMLKELHKRSEEIQKAPLKAVKDEE